MRKYRKDLYNKIRSIKQIISQRQVDIRREMKTDIDRKKKDELDIERKGNTSILRILSWIEFSLKYTSLESKLKRDSEFLAWMIIDNSYYYIFPTAGDTIGIPKDTYSYMRFNTILSYKYFSPTMIYRLIIDNVFQKPEGGIFGLLDEKNIEYDEIRNEFDNLIENDWKKFKEMGRV